MQDRAEIDAKRSQVPTRANMMVSKHHETTKRYDSGMMARFAAIQTDY